MTLLSDVGTEIFEALGDVSCLQMREWQVQVPRLLLYHGRGFLVGSLC